MQKWPKVMIVDDEPQQAVLAGLMIQDLYPSADIYTLKDVTKALEHAAAFEPELVVTDIRMGETSGIDICRRLKQDQYLGPKVKVVTMTGYPDFQTRADAALFGADAYLAKPIERDVWRRCLERLLKPSLKRSDSVDWKG